MKRKHVIWGNTLDELNPKSRNWRGFLKEIGLSKADEDVQYNAIADLNQDYWYDEKLALSEIDHSISLRDNGYNRFYTIIAVGSIGRWDGRVSGYRFIKNLEDILYSDVHGCDYFTLWCDRHLRLSGYHHDGSNSMTFLLFSGDSNEWYNTDGENKFLDDLACGRPISKARWHKYTRSLRPFIKEYYGWR